MKMQSPKGRTEREGNEMRGRDRGRRVGETWFIY
jgi:hypothetical protein